MSFKRGFSACSIFSGVAYHEDEGSDYESYYTWGGWGCRADSPSSLQYCRD